MGAKLWFRKDGSPRSKIKGLFIAAFAGASIYTFYAMMLLVEEFDTANYLLNSLVHIQRADVDLASVDLTDSLSVTSYFRSLCSSFDDIPPRMIEDFFREVSHLTGGSAESAHRIMRDASEDIHKILMRSKGKDPWFTGSEVIQRLDDGIGELMKLVEETMGEGDETFVSRRRQIKDRVASGKDLGSKNGNGDYELVG
ncbi:hypothetical protein BDN72DRAFT_767355 [Pluteus cervinus]|uniref:Uncharacterized protein n=1 Tax=Pluteus cervinus TaxID=181527 RepID=A0ACD3AV79_9AGAR|nr:hypothetical protein BDN72DRAFT_767355 [Pluteus cervinus]